MCWRLPSGKGWGWSRHPGRAGAPLRSMAISPYQGQGKALGANSHPLRFRAELGPSALSVHSPWSTCHLPWWRAARGGWQCSGHPGQAGSRGNSPSRPVGPGLFPVHCLCALTVNERLPWLCSEAGPDPGGVCFLCICVHPQARATWPQLAERVRWCRPGHTAV